MFSTVQRIPIFIKLFFCWLILGGVLQAFFTQKELIFWINQHFSTFGDVFFKYITHLGDGLFQAFLVALFFLKKQKKRAVLMLLGLVVSGGLSSLLKGVFSEALRPFAQYEGAKPHLVEGITMLYQHSFPSGHTTTAFSIAVLLSLFFKKTQLQILFFIGAILVAYSRMYLFQHFFKDVYAGSILGVLSTLLLVYFYENYATKRA